MVKDVPEPDRGWQAACAPGDYSFGPRAVPSNGLWSAGVVEIAFLAVPTLGNWAAAALVVVVGLLGCGIVLRSRPVNKCH